MTVSTHDDELNTGYESAEPFGRGHQIAAATAKV